MLHEMSIGRVIITDDVDHNISVSQEELEVIVAAFGLTDVHNRQHRHAAELYKREGIEGAQLALDADAQKKLYTKLAKAARSGRQV